MVFLLFAHGFSWTRFLMASHLERYCDGVDVVTGAIGAIVGAACLEVLLNLAPLDTAVAPESTGEGETPSPSPLPASVICSCCPLPFPTPAFRFPDAAGNMLTEFVPPSRPSCGAPVAVNRTWSIAASAPPPLNQH